jgi:nucleoside-triphosphatase
MNGNELASHLRQSSLSLLLTGLPGVGKTTLIRKIADALTLRGERIRGFTTEEIRVGGRREGFRIETFNRHNAILAHTNIRSPHRIGKYGVDVDAVDHVVDLVFGPDRSVSFYLIDEIGKMECFSPRFVAAMKALLDSGARVVATIPLKGRGFPQEVKRRPDVELWELTPRNRDELFGQAIAWLERGQRLNKAVD